MSDGVATTPGQETHHLFVHLDVIDFNRDDCQITRFICYKRMVNFMKYSKSTEK
jgi:hypothetical protein